MHFKILLHKKTVSCKQALIDQWENIISDVYKDIKKVIFSLYLWKSRKQRIYVIFSFFLCIYSESCEID